MDRGGGAAASWRRCASAQAKSPADRPTLEVPPAPPRVIESDAAAEPPPPEPVEDLPPASHRCRRGRAGAAAAKDAPNRAEAAEPAPAAEHRSTAAAAPRHCPCAAAPHAGDRGRRRGRAQVHDVIERAKRDLEDQLSAPEQRARQQYESAKLMLTQAEDALKAVRTSSSPGSSPKRPSRLAKELQGVSSRLGLPGSHR